MSQSARGLRAAFAFSLRRNFYILVRMKLGNHLFKTIKPAFVRFPAVYVLFVALAAVSCISTGNLLNNDILKKVFFALCWASITALSVQLAADDLDLRSVAGYAAR